MGPCSTTKKHSLFLATILSTIAVTLIAACTAPPPHPPKKAEPPVQHVDIKAQQLYYDQGLQYYAQENYRAAQESFQRVVDNGATTSLGRKAQENLKKIQQILKTLENIEAK